ncbi:MAG: hypothetical protein JWO89_787 [Verrucomicrobiaceae bacterium]|nr:hypothetical protein [Verrucomicrobiaceae bacterium]MDB6120425.1 hypothetical protein [Verrucomicrobiaceae bacterium]
MKRIFASIAILLTAFNSSAFALVGGPFDNGEQASSLEGGAFYQAILTFGNGSGFCYFSPNANIAGDGLNSFQVATRGTQLNRLVMYYKGLTYIGSAFGTVDHETRFVECSFNGNSTSNQSATNTATTANNGFQSSGASNPNAISTIILSNTVSFTVNGNFTAKIYQNAPTLRFRGKGELAFIAPSKADAQAGLAYSGFSGLINAIVTAVGNANVGANFNANVFTLAQLAIQNAIAAIPDLTSINSNFEAAETRAMTVYGSRKYL